MPMSPSFQERLLPVLPAICAHFGTPFHIYDAFGIMETGGELTRSFREIVFREFFAVKSLPNQRMLNLMRQIGFGFDCSSIPELIWSRRTGAGPGDIMFTSNNTTQADYHAAAAHGGCILNLDDISFVAKVPPPFPELISFRYNPGERRTGNTIIGNPVEAKYGVRHDQIVDAYRLAMARGARRFGIHTMVISNERDHTYMVETVRGLLEVVAMIYRELGIRFDWLNMGGGLGTPYRPEQNELNVPAMSRGVMEVLFDFKRDNGYMPALYMESGRYMTGPHGVLVTTVINRMSKYREYVGVDASMSSLMRPAMYGAEEGGYHHITVPGREDEKTEVVDVVGRICENCDKFAIQRALSRMEEGDAVLIHNTGAHAIAMAFNYNGTFRPKELLYDVDGSVKLVGREETFDDLDARNHFEPDTFTP